MEIMMCRRAPSRAVVMGVFMIMMMGYFLCEAIKIDGADENVLRNGVVANLHVIERELKVLREEGLVDDHAKRFDHLVPLIIHDFLSSNFEEAERNLGSLVHGLQSMFSSCTTNIGFNNSLLSGHYIPEAVIDFSMHALENAKRAHTWTEQLIQYKLLNKTSFGIPLRDQKLYYNHSLKRNKRPNCYADGTKCQYKPCARGNKLPICAIGFAAGVTGGARGSYYVVTRSDDDNVKNPIEGTLRHALEFAGKNKGGAWITFKYSMTIHLKEKLWIASHTTIDGRGVKVTITGKELVLARVENVILHNLEVLSVGDSDAIHVFDGSKRVWIDHLTSRDAVLGLVTVVQGSTDVTISNCYLSNHNFNMLLGASDQDSIDQVMRVTIFRNWFESSQQRMPHCRWGYCHVANNYYRDWRYYAIGGRAHAKIFSERNVFEPVHKQEVTPWHSHFTSDLTPTIKSSKDLLLNGATFHQFLVYGPLSSPQTLFRHYNLPVVSTKRVVVLVTKCAGVLFGDKVRHCRLGR
ncbi:hypothetical protein Syun_007598 [Stephania yunnanensis]|uniref:Pectate lyase n=1 Tax=Stephania yunnanensis TaxID=152371 RepID=A0AAP0PYN5_9MAGN